MIDQLSADLGSDQTVMVEVQPHELAVTALVDDQAATWACRDGAVAQVPSDITYVDQATFNVASFDIADIGALFRAAAAIAGSANNQRLQIVDYSGGRVMMAVATNPESRTVFFNPDGSLLEDLDFGTQGGLARGLNDIKGNLMSVFQIVIDSDKGAWVDSPGSDTDAVIRRRRSPRVPVTTITRNEHLSLQTFSPSVIDPAVIWQVVTDHTGTASPDVPWSVTIDDRAEHGQPRLYFAFGTETVVTDLGGQAITN